MPWSIWGIFSGNITGVHGTLHGLSRVWFGCLNMPLVLPCLAFACTLSPFTSTSTGKGAVKALASQWGSNVKAGGFKMIQVRKQLAGKWTRNERLIPIEHRNISFLLLMEEIIVNLPILQHHPQITRYFFKHFVCSKSQGLYYFPHSGTLKFFLNQLGD